MIQTLQNLLARRLPRVRGLPLRHQLRTPDCDLPGPLAQHLRRLSQLNHGPGLRIEAQPGLRQRLLQPGM